MWVPDSHGGEEQHSGSAGGWRRPWSGSQAQPDRSAHVPPLPLNLCLLPSHPTQNQLQGQGGGLPQQQHVISSLPPPTLQLPELPQQLVKSRHS